MLAKVIKSESSDGFIAQGFCGRTWTPNETFSLKVFYYPSFPRTQYGRKYSCNQPASLVDRYSGIILHLHFFHFAMLRNTIEY